ncbi:hypothetical protein Tcan_03957 [Toxocara canis]|uniref:Uncharacterized protein n=1 Tax=Toxocara canis TaxID=6265 RepID=A0A0B2UTK3_TOXCA|nr:hypothetical protein Tcan_03957 [Toxocara canis]
MHKHKLPLKQRRAVGKYRKEKFIQFLVVIFPHPNLYIQVYHHKLVMFSGIKRHTTVIANLVSTDFASGKMMNDIRATFHIIGSQQQQAGDHDTDTMPRY